MRKQHSQVGTDIPYILDPQYSGANHTSSSNTLPVTTTRPSPPSAPPSVYIDPQGRVHDPTYRMFAITDPYKHLRLRRLQRRRQSTPLRGDVTTSDNHDEEEEEEEEEVDDDLEYRNDIFNYARRRSTDSARPRTSSILSYASSTHPTYPIPPFTSSAPWPQSPSSTLPSYSPPDPDSPFTNNIRDAEDERQEEIQSHRSGRFSPRRTSLRSNVEFTRVDTVGSLASVHPPPIDEERDDATTCLQAIRRQWEILVLRVSFGVFRTKRRVASHLRMRIVTNRSAPIA